MWRYLLDKSEFFLASPIVRSNSLIRNLNSFTKWELLPGGAKLKYALALISWSFISFTFSSLALWDGIFTCWSRWTVFWLDFHCSQNKANTTYNKSYNFNIDKNNGWCLYLQGVPETWTTCTMKEKNPFFKVISVIF